METKKGADNLENWLCMNGFPATTIHGDRSQQVSELLTFKKKGGNVDYSRVQSNLKPYCVVMHTRKEKWH